MGFLEQKPSSVFLPPSKDPRVLRDLRMLPTVEEEAVKPSFLRRTVSFAFEEAGIPPRVFESVPQAPGFTEVSGPFWVFWTYPQGFGGFWGSAFSSTERSTLGYPIFCR
jgi:hypothetical protein